MNSYFMKIRGFFSCKRYSEICSKKRDQDVCLLEKAQYLFHHILCFTCRRFNSQLTVLDNILKSWKEHDCPFSAKMSDQAKNKISELINQEKSK